jgi:death-on-curing protein
LATEAIVYLTFAEAVWLHLRLMKQQGETRYGVFERGLVESALARPRHAAAYGNADLIGQAATLCYGLIKNHPWIGGNKRTATMLVEYFLFRNGIEVTALPSDSLVMVSAVDADQWNVQDIEIWLRQRTQKANVSSN